MNIVFYNAHREVQNYIDRVKNGGAPDICWEEEVMAAYWQKLCCYAPFDLSERKPKPITDIATLEKQCDLLAMLDMNALESDCRKTASALPGGDDDPITVVLFPGDNMQTIVNEKQNGVVGTSVFGNMYITVNPLIPGYEDWIRYVFAHEYHHAVWGGYWFVTHGGELENRFIDSLIIDGEADSFARELFPALKPLWLFGMTEDECNAIWERTYKALAEKTDVDYALYMFGSEEKDIPWCAGYAVGYMLVQKYLRLTHQSTADILTLKPVDLLKELNAM